jgi:hypothetical protein
VRPCRGWHAVDAGHGEAGGVSVRHRPGRARSGGLAHMGKKERSGRRTRRSIHLVLPVPSASCTMEKKKRIRAGVETKQKDPKLPGWHCSGCVAVHNGILAKTRCGMVYRRSPLPIMVSHQLAHLLLSQFPDQDRPQGQLENVQPNYTSKDYVLRH